MTFQSFIQIRSQFPEKFLVLLDYQDRLLPNGKLEILGAQEVQAFDTGDDMYGVYRDLRRSGKKAIFCTPDYRESFIIDRIPAMRVMAPCASN